MGIPVRTAAALLGLAALACAGAPPAEAPPAPVAGRVGRVEVTLASDAVGRGLPADALRSLRAVLRQSARDWLEQEDRLAPDAAPGALALEIRLESLRLRSGLVTWLFAWAAAPDHLAARVRVLRDGAPVSEGALRVESRLAGYSWRDPAPRLERLARRLGRRVAMGL